MSGVILVTVMIDALTPTVRLLKVTPFTVTLRLVVAVPSVNLSVTHLIWVLVEEITLHLVPSPNTIEIVEPSVRDGGKFEPTMVKVEPP